jgi:Tol biopolymer transport system component
MPPGGPARVEDPAPTRTSAELGIFADVRGWMAYGDEKGIWAIEPVNPDKDPVLLSPNEGEPIAWASDGSKLLILRAHNWGSPSLYYSLHVLNADGTETHLVTGTPRDWITGGSFTPDGSKVIYASTWGKNSGIYVVDANGGSPRLLYAAGRRPPPDSFQMAVFYPALSPDGSRIAYVEGMGDWGNSLWVMNADGTGKHQILGQEEDGQFGHVESLQWSPDGTRVAFGFPSTINVISTDGSELSLAVVHGRDPYWSPDGSRIVYMSGPWRHTERAARWMARWDGTQVHELGHGPSGPWNPLDPQT